MLTWAGSSDASTLRCARGARSEDKAVLVAHKHLVPAWEKVRACWGLGRNPLAADIGLQAARELAALGLVDLLEPWPALRDIAV